VLLSRSSCHPCRPHGVVFASGGQRPGAGIILLLRAAVRNSGRGTDGRAGSNARRQPAGRRRGRRAPCRQMAAAWRAYCRAAATGVRWHRHPSRRPRAGRGLPRRLGQHLPVAA
jgi:hypothetical protein